MTTLITRSIVCSVVRRTPAAPCTGRRSPPYLGRAELRSPIPFTPGARQSQALTTRNQRRKGRSRRLGVALLRSRMERSRSSRLESDNHRFHGIRVTRGFPRSLASRLEWTGNRFASTYGIPRKWSLLTEASSRPVKASDLDCSPNCESQASGWQLAYGRWTKPIVTVIFIHFPYSAALSHGSFPPSGQATRQAEPSGQVSEYGWRCKAPRIPGNGEPS